MAYLLELSLPNRLWWGTPGTLEEIDKALRRFKHRVRQLTGRSWGVSLNYRYRELRLYVVGWTNYFALSEYYRPVPTLSEWLGTVTK